MRGGRTPKYDWDYWRHKYVTGDDVVTYEWLSRVQGAPTYQALRNKASKEKWNIQRREFRYNVTTRASVHDEVKQSAEQVEKLVDLAEMITRQAEIAKEFQLLAKRWVRIASVDDVKPSEAITMFRDSAKIEQLLAGLLDPAEQEAKPTQVIIEQKDCRNPEIIAAENGSDTQSSAD